MRHHQREGTATPHVATTFLLALLFVTGVGAVGSREVMAGKTARGAPHAAAPQQPLMIAGRAVELAMIPASEHTARITVSPLQPDGTVLPLKDAPVIVGRDWPAPLLKTRSVTSDITVKWVDRRVRVTPHPLTLSLQRKDGSTVQQIRIDEETGAVTFRLGGSLVFGLGQGGPQFDRRGASYPMISNHGAYQLRLFGGRVPIPWLIGASGWAAFFHRPLGSLDLSGEEGRFIPWETEEALPLDLFVVAADQPSQIMAEYADLTGHPHMPPIWALGYQQSHRTLASREEVLSVARTFREKKLPCDVLIYLGTGWCPSGWNTGHGSFTFNERPFPDPEGMIHELNERGFHVVLHAVRPPRHLYGSVGDADVPADDENHAANYWATHLGVFRLGVDGWWPDASENLSVESRLARNRIYWEGPQRERPDLRTYALHRTGYAGMQRYGWLWSGDCDSAWETLRNHIPIGMNTSLSGVPFWGTDTGGFVTTKEYTGELYVRWFQFSAFTPLFRSHGRAWKLHLPWGWNTGNLGPPEMEPRNAGVPDTKELLNPQVEPICRKYLELRYRLMPYLYSAVREAHDTGLPIMRALWLHYPDDPHAVERGDEYLWGRDMLVAPVTEKGATSRKLYLPRGDWYDFWTETKVAGGQEISRAVDLATLPLYVRAGAILPLGPVKHYTAERTYGPLTLVVYPGTDGKFELYEDDGTTFAYRKGETMRLRLDWKDQERRLTISLAEGTKMLPPLARNIDIRLARENISRSIVFDGQPVEVSF